VEPVEKLTQAVVYQHHMNDGAVLAAVVTGVVGLLGVVVGALLTQRSQHAQWLRERKIAAISSYVEDMSLLVDRFNAGLSPTPAERIDWLHAQQSGRTTIHLLCDEDTWRAAEELARLARQIDGSREAMNAAVGALKEFVRWHGPKSDRPGEVVNTSAAAHCDPMAEFGD
jgi:hypothetical protein